MQVRQNDEPSVQSRGASFLYLSIYLLLKRIHQLVGQKMKINLLTNTIKKYRLLLALVIAPVLIVLYWVGVYSLSGDVDGVSSPSREAWLSTLAVLVNLASMIIGFVVIAALFEKENAEVQANELRRIVSEVTNTPSELDKIPWANLIENASEIDFVVQGWNGWAERSEIADALTRFFEQGGHFRLYVCHPDASEGSIARALMELRIGRTPEEVRVEINGTFRTINEAFQLGRNPKGIEPTFEQFQTSQVNWYFAASFINKKSAATTTTRDVIVFSIYSHTPGRRPWSMPAIMIYPDQPIKDWFKNELKHLSGEH